MKNKSLSQYKTIFSCIVALSFLLFFQNCTDVEFSEYQKSQNEERITKQDDSVIDDDITETIDIASNGTRIIVNQSLDIHRTESKQLDIVWTIDNSGSMALEAEHVRNNYLSFINSVQTIAEIKTALISYQGTTSTAVSVPETVDPNKHIQINQAVSSTNGLSLADTYSKGFLKLNFFRQSSQKIFVFVTDDNESRTKASNFLEEFKTYHGQDPVVYSFIGLGGGLSPCQAREGTRYKELSNQTKGEIYNICDTDWSSHFSKLIDHIALTTTTKFSLKYSELVKVNFVKVGNKVLSKDKYVIEKGLLTILDVNLLDGKDKVSIEYVIEK